MTETEKEKLNEELARLKEEHHNLIKCSNKYFLHRLGEVEDKIKAIEKLLISSESKGGKK